MKKILSLLTAAVLTSSSVASATAFTTNTNTKLSNIKTIKNLYGYKNAQEHIDTTYVYIYNSTSSKDSPLDGIVRMRMFIAKSNILWANYQGWSHFFRNFYGHITFWHPEVGYSAGKTTIPVAGGITGYIFDKNTLSTGNDMTYCYSVLASYWWAYSSEKYDFMGDIDLDRHNGPNSHMHGTYVDTLLRVANTTPADKTGISFVITFHLSGENRTYQNLDTSTIAYW